MEIMILLFDGGYKWMTIHMKKREDYIYNSPFMNGSLFIFIIIDIQKEKESQRQLQSPFPDLRALFV